MINNLKRRLILHNKGKGAKSTRGRNWKIIYKEKYTLDQAAAASIWVKDYLKHSLLKNKTLIFGNLNKKDKPITNNFINLFHGLHVAII